MDEKLCVCEGNNQDCRYCGGKGFTNENKVEIIKLYPTRKETAKEKSDVESYLHEEKEKLYVTPDNKHKRKAASSKKKKPHAKTIISHSIDETKHNGVGILDNSEIDPRQLIKNNKARKEKVMAQMVKDRKATEAKRKQKHTTKQKTKKRK